MYESPIKMFVTEIQNAYEDGVMKAVQNFGFNINKEELIKALQYDRGQYQKGYEDGRPQKGEWIDTLTIGASGREYLSYKCSKCGDHHGTRWNYCPYCGADMRPRTEKIYVPKEDFEVE